MTRTPPRGAQRLLRLCLSDEAFEIVTGDLDEEFARGRSTAWYWSHSIRSAVAHGAGQIAAGSSAFAGDMRIAARTLARTKRLALVATLTMGFGVALCATVLAAVNAYLLRGLPYPNADRLYNVGLFRPGVQLPPKLETLNWNSLEDIVDVSISWDLDLFNLRGAPYAEAAQGTWVTRGYLEGFGVRAARGRVFDARDFAPESSAVAIISHRLWQTRFNGDPAIVGRHFESFSIDRPDEIGVFTIVGVLPERHWHLQPFTDVLAPLKVPNMPYVMRVRDGVDAQVLADRITALVRSRHQMPEGWSATVTSAHESYVLSVQPLLLTLAAAAGLVLLIAAANVAVLLLIRAAARRPELAMRRALGATGARVARMLIAEAVVLGGAAGAIGLGLAQLLVTVLAPIVDRQLGRAVPGGPAALQLDGPVLLGVAAAGTLIVIVCSIVPIWAATRSAASPPQALGQKSAAGSRGQQRVRSILVVTEVAACLALLVSAVFMVQSSVRILDTDIGVRTDNVHVTSLSLRQASYPNPASRIGLMDRVSADAARIQDLGGVAFANSWPLQAPPQREVLSDGPGKPAMAGVQAVSAGYFDVLGIPIIDGRGFGTQDVLDGVRAAIVSATLAERTWPGQRAVGRRLRIMPPSTASPAPPPTTVEVVGVVAVSRHSHTETETADVFLALSQYGTHAPFVYLRTGGDAAAVFGQVRSVLLRIDEGVVTGSLRPLADIIDQQRAGSRFLSQLLVVFAGMATLLALVALHGVIAYAASQRRREIAIRMAIGATRGSIEVMLLRQGVVIVSAGLAAGVLGAVAIGRLLQSQLFGVTANDPVIITATAAAFAVIALAASFLPARQAASVDPSEALKGD